jgi:uncharacterized protein YndB with AHSA1/START domain
MIDQRTDLAVRKSVTVEAPQERAFAVFTNMTTWWIMDSHHIGEQVPEAIVMEPRAGGRWFERTSDGVETEWGRIIDWEPPTRVLLAWHLNHEWEFDPDPEKATEIEVHFVAEGPTTTRVELEHRGFERLGEHAASVSEAVGSPNGWSGLLALYAKVAEAD